MASIMGRIRVLEAMAAGGGCRRCGGVIGVFEGGGLKRASKHGEAMSAEEWQEITAKDGRCPACGRPPTRINVVEEG